MCDTGHAHDHDQFRIPRRYAARFARSSTRALVRWRATSSNVERIEAIEPAFAQLLATDGWLPDEYAEPRRKEPDGRRHRAIRALSRRGRVALPLFARGACRRGDAGARPPRVGPGRRVSRRTGRNRLPTPRRRQRPDARRARDREAATAEARRLLPLIPPTDDIHYVKTTSPTGVDLDPSARERHRMHLAAQVRAELRRGNAVPIGLRERAVRRGYSIGITSFPAQRGICTYFDRARYESPADNTCPCGRLRTEISHS